MLLIKRRILTDLKIIGMLLVIIASVGYLKPQKKIDLSVFRLSTSEFPAGWQLYRQGYDNMLRRNYISTYYQSFSYSDYHRFGIDIALFSSIKEATNDYNQLYEPYSSDKLFFPIGTSIPKINLNADDWSFFCFDLGWQLPSDPGFNCSYLARYGKVVVFVRSVQEKNNQIMTITQLGKLIELIDNKLAFECNPICELTHEQ